MRKLILFAPLAVALTAVAAFAAADMAGYCQAPSTVTTAIPPNVLLMVDGTGSMSTYAYNSTSTPYDPNKAYEGYFDPEQEYVQESNGIWVEKGNRVCTKTCTPTCEETNVAGTCGAKNSTWNGKTCSGKLGYPCCISTTISYCPEADNGNHLNYLNMERIDGIHWALTGGTPLGCNGTVANCDASQITKKPIYTGTTANTCYDDGTVVINGDTVNVPGGCIIKTNNGTQVRARWDRLTGNNGGLLYKLQGLPIQPRIGLMLFDSTTAATAVSGNVLIGDFKPTSPSPPSYDAAHPYQNTIAAVNAKNPGNSTATGPALRAAQAYFAQQSAVNGGPAPQTVTSGVADPATRWKNPLYQCNDKNNDGTCTSDEMVLMTCANNFIILLSDGEWNIGEDPVTAAYEMHKLGFSNPALPSGETRRINTIYSIGLWLTPGAGERAMQHIAMYGGFDTNNGTRDWPGGTTQLPNTSLTVALPITSQTVSYPDWDKNKDGIPDNYLLANSASEIKNQIAAIILDLFKKPSSGTAVSVLGGSEGSGAFILQTLFQPKRGFKVGEVAWTSDLMSYWYYMDPYFTSMYIHEDTVREGATATPPYTLLDLQQDYITSLKYNPVKDQTLASLWEGSVSTANERGERSLDTSRAIWRAGLNLWWTKPADRTVYTSLDGSTLMKFDTTPENSTDPAPGAVLAPYLGQSSSTDAEAIIKYVRGSDCVDASGADCTCNTPGCGCTDDKGDPCSCGDPACTGGAKIGRSRTVGTGVCSVGTNDNSGRRSPCVDDTDCPTNETCKLETHVWKMGDIVSSTPLSMSPGALNTYNLQPPYGYNDQSYGRYIRSNDYQNRQLVFAGANDGMLHAFWLGKLLQKWPGKDRTKWWQVAKLEGGTGPGGIGTEAYAFIPKNVLPYLQYLKEEDYCHIYMVDGPITLADAAINPSLSPSSTCKDENYWDCPKITTMKTGSPNDVDFAKTSWRAVLIGSMGIGGATCNAATANSNRIQTPLAVNGQDVGWSSYFALDVTDQTAPKLLWEFAHSDLGVTNVGPAIVRVGGTDRRCSDSGMSCSTNSGCGTGAQCVGTNGRWFAVLASGSTGPIDNGEFKGLSDKTLKLFILDLKTGELVRTIDTGAIGIANAFSGAISDSTIDLERDQPWQGGNYQHDALYIGYVRNVTQGGVLRLVINDDSDPAHWTVSNVFADGVLGPVTASIATTLERKAGKLWLYFGEGRYFYRQDDTGVPSSPTATPIQRRFFGVQDPCFDNATRAIVSTCSPLQLSDLQDQSTPDPTLATGKRGWYIRLNAADSTSSAERVTAGATIDPQGGIYFTSFVPTSDICSLGGKFRLWVVDYATGGKVRYRLQGRVLLQASTGEIKEVDLSSALTGITVTGGATAGVTIGAGTSTDWMSGMPSQQRPVGNPLPGFRGFMHIQEE